MNRRSAIALGLLLMGSAFTGPSDAAQNSKYVTLLDGKSMGDFTPIGNANWRVVDGAVYADRGNGFLVSKQSYADFHLRAEVWVDEPANSGIFIRCENPQNVSGQSSYEVNIFDTRPDQSYGTGSIVNVAKVSPMPHAANKWNVMEITAKGPLMVITFNGKVSTSGTDPKHPRGRIALQYGGGVVKFRKVEIMPL
ncbi:MAG TPA: DUF1080 domain-containing protein [Micropepsaceae bacterium]|nr:DUF1080 domain-containing protein [Micropepsaceae bacterium]